MYKLLLKQFVIIVLIILSVFGVVFGAFLPREKSRMYIDAMLDMQSGKTYTSEEFERQMGGVFNFVSPVGQEETVKYLGSDILNVIAQQGFPEEPSRFLVYFIDGYLFKDNVRHLILSGALYQTLWQHFGREEDFKKSEDYFKKAYSIGPNLPPVLYDLFELYRLRGDSENMNKIGEEILKYWPDAQSVKSLIRQ